MSNTSDPHLGSSFDRFLEEEGLLESTQVVAIKRVMAWQLEQAMKAKRLTKQNLAKQLHTSRSQVDRLLDPRYVGVSLESLAKAADAVGKCVQIQLVDKVRPRRAQAGKRAVAVRKRA
jgi:antitoxin HicB